MKKHILKLIRRKKALRRERYFKTSVSFPIKIRVIDLPSGNGLTSWVEGETAVLAEDGFLVEVDRVMVDGYHLFTDAMKEGRGVDLQWQLPGDETMLQGRGRVLWFKLTPPASVHSFQAAVELLEMPAEYLGRWQTFIASLTD